MKYRDSPRSHKKVINIREQFPISSLISIQKKREPSLYRKRKQLKYERNPFKIIKKKKTDGILAKCVSNLFTERTSADAISNEWTTNCTESVCIMEVYFFFCVKAARFRSRKHAENFADRTFEKRRNSCLNCHRRASKLHRPVQIVRCIQCFNAFSRRVAGVCVCDLHVSAIRCLIRRFL